MEILKRPIERLKDLELAQIKQELAKIDKKSLKSEDLLRRIELLEQYQKINGGKA